MHRLDAPAAFDKLDREPIQQLGVSRTRAIATEVIWRLDDATAEVMTPNAINHHASREWIIGVGNPLRERQSPPTRSRRRAAGAESLVEWRGA